jgi:hypothetical protein
MLSSTRDFLAMQEVIARANRFLRSDAELVSLKEQLLTCGYSISYLDPREVNYIFTPSLPGFNVPISRYTPTIEDVKDSIVERKYIIALREVDVDNYITIEGYSAIDKHVLLSKSTLRTYEYVKIRSKHLKTKINYYANDSSKPLTEQELNHILVGYISKLNNSLDITFDNIAFVMANFKKASSIYAKVYQELHLDGDITSLLLYDDVTNQTV